MVNFDMVETVSSTFLNNFVLIFVAIDPFALIPIFAGITHGLQKKEILESEKKEIEVISLFLPKQLTFY